MLILTDEEIGMLRVMIRNQRNKLVKQYDELRKKFGDQANVESVVSKYQILQSIERKLF